MEGQNSKQENSNTMVDLVSQLQNKNLMIQQLLSANEELLAGHEKLYRQIQELLEAKNSLAKQNQLLLVERQKLFQENSDLKLSMEVEIENRMKQIDPLQTAEQLKQANVYLLDSIQQNNALVHQVHRLQQTVTKQRNQLQDCSCNYSDQ